MNTKGRRVSKNVVDKRGQGTGASLLSGIKLYKGQFGNVASGKSTTAPGVKGSKLPASMKRLKAQWGTGSSPRGTKMPASMKWAKANRKRSPVKTSWKISPKRIPPPVKRKPSR